MESLIPLRLDDAILRQGRSREFESLFASGKRESGPLRL